MQRPAAQPVDISEKGAARDGQPQSSDRRLFMQFLAVTGEVRTAEVVRALEPSGLECVLYADAHDPHGYGLLTLSEDPGVFVGALRERLHAAPLCELRIKPDYTMLGRTYALGYEPDLEDTLLHRPRRTALNPEADWAVWYPLRRKGSFARLDPQEQRAMLMEHGQIGLSFGAADLGHDVRLACFGLDPRDNDFVIGLIGRRLAPLSKLVEAMRKTRQTAEYIERLGPFFVGRAIWRSGQSIR